MAYGLRNITFNGYDLQTSDVTVTSLPDIDDVGNIENNYLPLSTSNGQKIFETRYSGRRITLSGYIFGSSVADIEQKMDEMKKSIDQGIASFLDIDYAGSTRRWKAKVDSIEFGARLGTTRQFVVLLSTLGFGYDIIPQSLVYANETGAKTTKTIDFDGSIYPLPIYTIDVNSSSGLTSISIENTTANKKIIVGNAFTSGDQLIVNTEEKYVLYNGANSDFQGVSPEVKKGQNNIKFEFGSVSHDVDITVTYNPRYL
jgi:hypothetical protein